MTRFKIKRQWIDVKYLFYGKCEGKDFILWIQTLQAAYIETCRKLINVANYKIIPFIVFFLSGIHVYF